MSQFSDYLTKQKAFNERDDKATSAISASIDNITHDVAGLNATIKQLQDSAGAVTPEDQALIDQLQTQGDAVASKLETASTALQALDESTPPTAPAA